MSSSLLPHVRHDELTAANSHYRHFLFPFPSAISDADPKLPRPVSHLSRCRLLHQRADRHRADNQRGRILDMRIHSLGYVGVESPAASEWLTIGPDVYGLEVADRTDSAGEHVLRVSWDDRAYRLALHPGPEHKLAYLGWEL